MSFSYDPTLSDDISKLRFLLDDTDMNYYEFKDEELQGLLVIYGSVEKAAIQALKKMILTLSKMATVAEVDDLRIEYRDKADALNLILKSLEDEVDNGIKKFKSAPVYFGGVIKNNYLANKEDSSVVQPRFQRGMDDNGVCVIESVGEDCTC